jgi:V/A-type H+-transporting ATPase subunit C
MTTQASHIYLKTRAAVLAERLLSEQQLQTLSTSPLRQLLSRFQLEELEDEGIADSHLNRSVERALIRTLMHELSVLLRPLEGSSRDLLVHWTRKYELYNLKALIRGKLRNLTYDEIQQTLHDLPSLISLPHEKLLRTENIAELLRQLEQGHYGDIARQARHVYEEKNEPFSLDATIDQRYFTGLLKRARNTGTEDRASLLEFIGTLIDQHNLLWLLRYRFNYALSPTETYYLLIPFGRHLKRDRLREMVNLGSFSEVRELIPDALSHRFLQCETLMEAEQAMQEETVQEARRNLRFSPSAVTRALTYLVLREIDLKRIFAIIQGKVLSLDDGLIAEAAGVAVNGGEAVHV